MGRVNIEREALEASKGAMSHWDLFCTLVPISIAIGIVCTITALRKIVAQTTLASKIVVFLSTTATRSLSAYMGLLWTTDKTVEFSQLAAICAAILGVDGIFIIIKLVLGVDAKKVDADGVGRGESGFKTTNKRE